MNEFSNLVIRPLDTDHHRPSFHSGVASLDYYIQKQAFQDLKRRISQVFVATTVKQPKIILGYYTLSALSIELDQLPETLVHKLPRHPIPAALIGRLAVNQSAQNHGVGKCY